MGAVAAAHPRVGGENAKGAGNALLGAGSSPRGRGKLGPLPDAHHGRGLIPAWAGKTVSAGKTQCPKPAHPRVGGENPHPVVVAGAGWGSSPRGRGKHSGVLNEFAHARLIPAWAGKTVF